MQRVPLERIIVLLIGLSLLAITSACQPEPTITLAAIATVPLELLQPTPSPQSTPTDIPTQVPSPVFSPTLFETAQYETATRLPTVTPFPTKTRFPTRLPTNTVPPPTNTPMLVTPTSAATATIAETGMPVSSGRSKLGIHVIRNNNAKILEFVQQAQPAVVVAVDDLGWLVDLKQVSPNTITIGRLTVNNQKIRGDPVEAAQNFVDKYLPTYVLNPGVDYWQGWNEPDPGDDMSWYASFEAERVRLLAAQGIKAAVGGFPAGVPELEDFYDFIPALEAAQFNGGIFVVHEFSAPFLDTLYGDPLPGYQSYANRGPLAMRYRWYYEDILIPRGNHVPLVISEVGINGNVIDPDDRPGPAGAGWKDFTGYWQDKGMGNGTSVYLSQLAWYDTEVQKDNYVLGFAVFSAGVTSDWSSFDVTGILPNMAEYVLSGQ